MASMKLGVFTDEVSQDLDRAVKLATRFSCDGVEIRSVWGKSVQHLDDEDLARIRSTLHPAGLAVCAIASPVFKCELDDDAAHEEHLDYLRNCIRVAKALETSIVRIFTFWKHGPSEPVWDKIKAKFAPALPIAEEAGITLGLENEASTYVATAAEAKRFVEEMASPALKITWDPCNEVYADEGITPYPDAYRLVEPWVVHVHVKDAKRDRGAKEATIMPIGEGIVDWKGQFRELLSKGYDGYVSLETHWRPQALTEEQMNRPGGKSFSESGEHASTVCMENLVAILAEARRELGGSA